MDNGNAKIDKSKFRKENGYFIRRVGPQEMGSCYSYKIEDDGQVKCFFYPPEDAVALVVVEPEDETDKTSPTLEFVYSTKQLAKQYGKLKGGSSSSKPSKVKFGLKEFAELFVDAEKRRHYKGSPSSSMCRRQLAKLQQPDDWSRFYDFSVTTQATHGAYLRWEQEYSENLCPCRKERIIEKIKYEHEKNQAKRTILRGFVMAYDASVSMLLDQLYQMGYVLAEKRIDGEKRWSLVERKFCRKLFLEKQWHWLTEGTCLTN